MKQAIKLPQTAHRTPRPLIAGFLALAKQKWPNATNNQLLQLLTKTALNNEGQWNKYTGYGVADLGAMMNTDPSQYPDENPLMDPTQHKGPTTDESSST